MSVIEFNEELHEYKVDGVIKPSVTTILKDVGIINYEGLDPWYATRGKIIHKACELYDLGTLDESTIDPVIEPFITAYKLFKQEVNPLWNGIEQKIYNGLYGYCGAYDRRGIVFGKLTIVDIKTNNTPSWAGIQISAYSMPDGVVNRAALVLKEDRSYKLIDYPVSSLQKDFSIFISALNVYRYKHEK